MYVDADELPGAWRMTGRYQRTGEKVTVKVVLRDGAKRKEFTAVGMATDLPGLAGGILEKAQKAVGE